MEEWASGDENFLEFPESYTAAKRRNIHMICEELNLDHSSIGEEDDRRLAVRKKVELVLNSTDSRIDNEENDPSLNLELNEELPD